MGELVIKFRAGPCAAAIFANTHTSQGETFVTHNVVLERTYKDRDGRFQTTTGLRLDDIPKAIVALGQSYAYLLALKRRASGGVPQSATSPKPG